MRILFVTPHYACKPTSGGGQRTQLLLAALEALPFIDAIDIAVLDEQGRSATEFFSGSYKVRTIKLKSRAELGLWRYLKALIGARADTLATSFGARKTQYSSAMIAAQDKPDWSQYDAVVGRYLRPTAMLGCFESSLPIYLDIDDRDDVLYSSRLNAPNLNFVKKLILRWHLKQMQNIQSKLLPLCRHAWLASAGDLGQLPTVSESVLPNIPYTNQDIDIPDLNGQTDLLFIGAAGHRINREGVMWFLDNCWQEITDAVPDITLRIVGSGGWENYANQYRYLQGVEFVGFCDSLAEEYERCRFTLVPLFEGGGTKIKVLESYLYNRVACGTGHAYLGYQELAELAGDAIESGKDAFANKVIALLRTPETALQEIAHGGRSLVESEFSREAFNRAVLDGIDEV